MFRQRNALRGGSFQMAGFKSLKEGMKVSFDVVQGPKGKQASNINKA